MSIVLGFMKHGIVAVLGIAGLIPTVSTQTPSVADLSPMSHYQASILFWYYLVLSIASLVLAIGLWPDQTQTANESTIRIFWFKGTLQRESRLVMTVVVMGFLGGTANYFWLFTHHAALDQLKASQVFIYIAKPWIAAAIALVSYGLLRGGLTSGIEASKDLNSFGIAGFAGLVGLFANQVLAKLGKVFE